MTSLATSTTITSETAQAFLRKWAGARNAHDGAAVAALCAPGLVYDEPALGDTVHGREPIAAFVEQMAEMFPDYRFGLEGLYIEVSRPALLVAWTMTGTLVGTTRTLFMHGDDRLEFDEDGLIGTYRCLYHHKLVRRVLRGDGS